MKYQRKPVIVEAIQFNGYNYVDVCEFMGFPKPFHIDMNKQTIFINTLEGEMKARKDDFIIRGVKGEYYPCKPDIFTEIYEAIPLKDEGNIE